MSNSMEWIYDVPWIVGAPGKRKMVTGLHQMPALMLQAHTEMLNARPQGTADNGEFGLIKATFQDGYVSLVFRLELVPE